MCLKIWVNASSTCCFWVTVSLTRVPMPIKAAPPLLEFWNVQMDYLKYNCFRAPRDQIFVLFMFQFSKIAKGPKSDIWERKNPQHKIEENSSAKIKKRKMSAAFEGESTKYFCTINVTTNCRKPAQWKRGGIGNNRSTNPANFLCT